MAQYYIMVNGQQTGPMPKESLINYGLTPQSQVWTEGMSQWAPAGTVPELAAMFAPAKPVVPRKVERMNMGIFFLVLGGIGYPYFYAGKTTAAILTILLTIVTCGLWNIYNLIQGVRVLQMDDDRFKRIFVDSPDGFPLYWD